MGQRHIWDSGTDETAAHMGQRQLQHSAERIWALPLCAHQPLGCRQRCLWHSVERLLVVATQALKAELLRALPLRLTSNCVKLCTAYGTA